MRPLLSFTATVLLSALAASADVRFQVQPERTRTTLDQPVRVTVVIVSSKDLGQVAAPSVPASDLYQVLRTERNQSSSSSINIVNGRAERTVEISYFFYYTVAPKQLGSFTFPALSVTVQGQTYTSTPFTIEVLKEPVQSPDVIARLRCSKTRLHAGEQGVLTVVVGQKAGASVQLSSEGFRGLLNSVIEAAGSKLSLIDITKGKVGGVEELVDGERYVVYKYSFCVIPLVSGELSLGPAALQYQVLRRAQRRGYDPFEDFFGGSFFGGGIQATPATVMSNALRFTVLPLPPAPADFCGAVGSASLSAEVNPRDVPAGEAVTLKLVVKATTRPGSLSELALPSVPNLEVFSPEKQTVADTSASGISTRRTYKYMLIPRAEGTITLPAIGISYFDPASASFRRVSTDPVTLSVGKGTQQPGAARRYLTQEEIREVGQDINFIKTPASVRGQGLYPHRSVVLYLVNTLPIFIALFALLYRVQATRLARDPSLGLRRGAWRNFSRALARLRQQSASSRFLSALHSALETYICHRFGFAAAGMTIDELTTALAERGATQESLNALRDLQTQIDAARFGGGTVAAADALRQRVMDVAKGLESATRRAP